MKDSEFVFDGIDLLCYNCHKISLNCGRSYQDSPKRLKSTKATINPKNNDEKCFQCIVTVALSQEQIENYPENCQKLNLS